MSAFVAKLGQPFYVCAVPGLLFGLIAAVLVIAHARTKPDAKSTARFMSRTVLGLVLVNAAPLVGLRYVVAHLVTDAGWPVGEMAGGYLGGVGIVLLPVLIFRFAMECTEFAREERRSADLPKIVGEMRQGKKMSAKDVADTLGLPIAEVKRLHREYLLSRVKEEKSVVRWAKRAINGLSKPSKETTRRNLDESTTASTGPSTSAGPMSEGE